MKIIHLSAENVKKLKAVEITPDGSIVQITGKNGAGKSSVLDSIFYALAGGKALPKEPLRRGTKAGHVKLDLGEIIVTRKFAEGGATSLVVESTTGARFSSPQRMLDELLGAISFDPLAFSRMEPKRQLETLRQVSKLDIDLDAIAGKNKSDFEARTEVNRAAKVFRAQADGIILPTDLPTEAVDVDALLTEMENAATHNGDIERHKANRDNLAATLAAGTDQADALEAGLAGAENAIDSDAEEKIADLQAQIKRITDRATQDRSTLRNITVAKVDELRRTIAETQEKLVRGAGDLPAPIDTGAVRLKIEQGRTINALIDKRVQRQRYEAEAAKLEAKSKDLTESIEAREKVKAAAITGAKLPIADITFGDDQVLYKALPFDQASSAEQLRVSVAIAMAANPKLRVLRIKEGSLLDESGMQILREMTEAADYQCWIETVHANGPVAVEMVDGSAKAAEPKADATTGAPADAKLI